MPSAAGGILADAAADDTADAARAGDKPTDGPAPVEITPIVEKSAKDGKRDDRDAPLSSLRDRRRSSRSRERDRRRSSPARCDARR